MGIHAQLSAITLGMVLSLNTVADTITIRADEWYPINGVPNSNDEGYMIDLAREVFTQAGHQVDYQTMPWERAVQGAKEGNIDCIVGAYDTEEGLVFPTESWGTDEVFFYVKAGNSWQYSGLDSLAGVKVGIINGYDYSDDLTEYSKQHASQFQILSANNALEQNIKKVQAGRIDATVESPLVMGAKLKEMAMAGQLVRAGRLTEPTPMFIGCSGAKARSQEYVRLVDEGTRALRENGRLQAILDKYGLEDWK